MGEACSVEDVFIPDAENKSNQQPISFRLPASSCSWGRAVTCTLTWHNYDAISVCFAEKQNHSNIFILKTTKMQSNVLYAISF